MPMWRSHSRHLSVSIDQSTGTHFTRTPLYKVHYQFFHTSAETLYKLLKRSRPADTSPETSMVQEEMIRRCGLCQRIRPAQLDFFHSLGAEDVQFNERVMMDIFYLGHTPVPHIYDEEKKFSSNAFLLNVATDVIWSTFNVLVYKLHMPPKPPHV